MGEIILEIMSEECREKYREKYSEPIEDLYKFFIEFMRQCANAPYLTGPGHSAAAAPEPSASLSAGLFGRSTMPIPAPLDLSHTQFFLINLNLSRFVMI